MPDFNADVTEMETPVLLEYQQEMTRARLAANDAGRRAQAEIDRRAAERAEQRAAEDSEFGAVRKPPTQAVFGEPTAEEEEVSADG